ncbi:MAG: hypothetical protein V5786_00260 [Psychromonas sp.]
MNKSILASVIFTTLLSGCGSSGGGSSPLTYKWQMIQLVSMTEGDADIEGCIIYADSDENDGEVISAVIATRGYKILYHHPDGSLKDEYSPSETTGSFEIVVDDIPDDGYVSVEEISNPYSSTTDVYMFSVEKSLLSDLVVSVRTFQDDDEPCYEGSNYRDTVNEDGTPVIDVGYSSDDIVYYQTSYGIGALDGKVGPNPTEIPVKSPLPPLEAEYVMHDVLVTAFSLYDNNEGFTISHYGFLKGDDYIYNSLDEPSSVYTPTLFDEIDNSSYYWDTKTSNNVTFVDKDIYALHRDSDIIYYWQPLYQEGNSLSIISSDANQDQKVSNWSAYFTGDVEASWKFESFVTFGSNNDGLVEFYLPELFSIENIQVVDGDSCNSGVEHCVNISSYYNNNEFTYQRTYLKTLIPYGNSSSSSTIIQSIYAPVSDVFILLETSVDSLKDVSVTTINNDLTIALNLIKSDTNSLDAIQYLMSQSMDEVTLGDDQINITDDSFSDANGFVATGDERDALELAIFKSTTLIVKSEISEEL